MKLPWQSKCEFTSFEEAQQRAAEEAHWKRLVAVDMEVSDVVESHA